MKSVVIGTAGHIDHGKTALVRRLTGIDADRLEEEKRRGMTIDLGFAPLILPSGNEISIIDVPGHEKFIKNMVAGVIGIDAVILVIASDEGIMPQTKEHIDILSLLNVKAGVVALTKTDLVDDEWIEMVIDDVNEALKNTTLDGIPIIPVSSVTGKGIEELVAVLEKISVTASEKDGNGLFRLPVDRIFTITGHGTVVTGTITGGKISKGDSIEILPSGLSARVREIQVHNKGEEHARAGDRCALNLSGIEKSNIQRGDVITCRDTIRPTMIADAVLHTVKGNNSITHNQRVHVHIGTKETTARIRILGADEIPEGSKGYVQIRFEEPVALSREDRFIIRSYSPVRTLGGGWVIFHTTRNRKRFSEDSIEALKIGETGSDQQVVMHLLRTSKKVLGISDIWRELFIDVNSIQEIMDKELDCGKILRLKESNRYLERGLYNEFINNINSEFENLYKKYPFRYQIDREEIKSRVFDDVDSKDFTAILTLMVEDNLFVREGNSITQPGDIAVKRISERKETAIVEKTLLKDGLNFRTAQQISQEISIEPQKIEDIEKFLVNKGTAIDLGGGTMIHIEPFKQSVEKIRSFINVQGSASAAQIRDLLGISRKTAIILLEYLDRIEFTQRVEDNRVPGPNYAKNF
jgi:selenocysteine-specific elongation factor